MLERGSPDLEESLRDHEPVLVAFSGGADSAFLLAAAVRALGAENVAAATAYSDSLPPPSAARPGSSPSRSGWRC